MKTPKPSRAVPALLLVVLLTAGAVVLVACGKTSAAPTSSLSPRSSVAAAAPSQAPSPTGSGPGTIAFIRVSENGGKDIYLIHSNGTGLRRLTNTPESEDLPTWSPNGSRIAFVRFIGGPDDANTTIWVMNADGSHQRRITSDAVRGYPGTWSPDGGRLVFSKCRGEEPGYDLAVMDVDGSGVRRVMNAAESEVWWHCRWPTWAPDGRIFFSQRGTGICSVNPDGSGLRVVTPLSDSLFSISPDGKRLLVWEPQNDRLALLPAGGQGAEEVLLEHVSRYLPLDVPVATSWSPDGKAIAFAAGSSAGGLEQASSLFALSADGSLRSVPNAGKVYDPVWRPR